MKRLIAAFATAAMIAAIIPSMATAGGSNSRVERLEARVETLKERRDAIKAQRDALIYKYERPAQCSATASCKPVQYDYLPWSADEGNVYRVRFIENVGADQYRWFAGPFFTLDDAIDASGVIAEASGTAEGSVTVEVSSGSTWQAFAD